MKKFILVTVLCISFLWSSAQYVATWDVPEGTKSSDVMRSVDGKKFTVVKNVKTGTYTTTTGATYYWTVRLNGDKTTYTDTVWVYAPVTITSSKIRFSGNNAILSWRAYTETNMTYYTIESINNSTTVMKHGGSYTVTVPKIGVTYSITAHYKNGKNQVLKIFNP